MHRDQLYPLHITTILVEITLGPKSSNISYPIRAGKKKIQPACPDEIQFIPTRSLKHLVTNIIIGPGPGAGLGGGVDPQQ